MLPPGNEHAIKLLLRFKAKPNIRNFKNQIPADLVNDEGLKKVLQRKTPVQSVGPAGLDALQDEDNEGGCDFLLFCFCEMYSCLTLKCWLFMIVY